jgi:uncharacterized damage-inducible protein DinB
MNSSQAWLNRDRRNWPSAHVAPAILLMLAEFPDQLEQCLSSLDQECLTKTDGNNWSPLEHAGHLLAMESLWIARIDDFVLNHPTLRAWNGDNRDVRLAKFNQQNCRAICRDFNQTRLAIVDYVRKLVESESSFQSHEPQWERTFTLNDHLAYMHEHDKHHLQTIQFIAQPNA